MSLVCTSKGHLKRGGVIQDFSLKSCMAIFNMKLYEERIRRNDRRMGNDAMENGESLKRGIFQMGNLQKQESLK